MVTSFLLLVFEPGERLTSRWVLTHGWVWIKQIFNVFWLGLRRLSFNRSMTYGWYSLCAHLPAAAVFSVSLLRRVIRPFLLFLMPCRCVLFLSSLSSDLMLTAVLFSAFKIIIIFVDSHFLLWLWHQNKFFCFGSLAWNSNSPLQRGI